MRIYIPICTVIRADGTIAQQPIFSMGRLVSEFPNRTEADNYYSQFAPCWAETYDGLGIELVSVHIAEFIEESPVSPI